MSLLFTLNRRNKAALFATLVCVGLILALTNQVYLSLGVGLLGIAYSWVFGSNRRVVHWLFIIFGLLLLIAPVWDAITWPATKSELVNDQNEMVNTDLDLIRGIAQQEDTETDKAEKRELLKELLQAQDAQSKDESALHILQGEGVSARVLKNDWASGVSGLLLLCSGVGLIIGVRATGNSARVP